MKYIMLFSVIIFLMILGGSLGDIEYDSISGDTLADRLFTIADSTFTPNITTKGYFLGNPDSVWDPFIGRLISCEWTPYSNVMIEWDYADTLIIRGGTLKKLNDSTYLMIKIKK